MSKRKFFDCIVMVSDLMCKFASFDFGIGFCKLNFARRVEDKGSKSSPVKVSPKSVLSSTLLVELLSESGQRLVLVVSSTFY